MTNLSHIGIPPRSESDRAIAGVCGGLATATRIDPVVIRVVMVVMAAIGPGIPLYLVAWLIMPAGSKGTLEVGTASDSDTARPPQLYFGRLSRRGVGLGLLVLGLALAARELGLTPPDSVVIPVSIVGVGLGVVMWQLQPSSRTDRWLAGRIAAGVAVVGLGVAAFVAGNVSFDVVRDGLLATLLVIAGAGLIVGPWMAALVRSRQQERKKRLQADARAEMAAHLHDSVLQTFAMIQRTDDPRAMSSLARSQERELRRWLYGRRGDDADATVESVLSAMIDAIEADHDLAVEAVVVGDQPIDARSEALVAAVGEALTNAAKWSGCDRVSVFIEVEPERIDAYVRDTGVGFDPDAVAPDRLGLKESIVGRMRRVGGNAEVLTAIGEGTEVHLFVAAP